MFYRRLEIDIWYLVLPLYYLKFNFSYLGEILDDLEQ